MMIRPRVLAPVLIALLAASSASAGDRWSPDKARAWAEKTPWLVGANYAPAYAINQLEMWQPDTFDPAAIDRELGWAEKLGFNSLRVFTHDILHKDDPEGFLKRVDQFLTIADRHGIGVVLVPFDAVWDPAPRSGPQRAPKPGVHNSGWMQSPGAAILRDPARQDELKPYIQALIGRFKDDRRVQAWDLFNEPDNPNTTAYGPVELPDKADRARELLAKTFAWAREIDPSQPLTSGVWTGDWTDGKLSPMAQLQLGESDVISFHWYGTLETLKDRVAELRRFDRPLICTEYMARPQGSTFDPVLGYFESEKIGAHNWGFVSGKSQTIYPWDSWKKPYPSEPKVWFHDIFRPDGSPYIPAEVEYIRSITARAKGR
jgi:hypothetical protein